MRVPCSSRPETVLTATGEEIAGFRRYLETFKKALPIEKAALKALR